VDRHGRIYAVWYQDAGDCVDDAGDRGESLFARVVAGRRLSRVRELEACSVL
jgi:hypothetical protein